MVIGHPRSYVDALYCILYIFSVALHDVSPPTERPTRLPRLLVVSSFPFLSSGLLLLLLSMISENGSRSREIRIANAADIYFYGAGGYMDTKYQQISLNVHLPSQKLPQEGSDLAKAVTCMLRNQTIKYLAEDQGILSRTDAQNMDGRLTSKARNSQRSGTNYFKYIQFILSIV